MNLCASTRGWSHRGRPLLGVSRAPSARDRAPPSPTPFPAAGAPTLGSFSRRRERRGQGWWAPLPLSFNRWGHRRPAHRTPTCRRPRQKDSGSPSPAARSAGPPSCPRLDGPHGIERRDPDPRGRDNGRRNVVEGARRRGLPDRSECDRTWYDDSCDGVRPLGRSNSDPGGPRSNLGVLTSKWLDYERQNDRVWRSSDGCQSHYDFAARA